MDNLMEFLNNGKAHVKVEMNADDLMAFSENLIQRPKDELVTMVEEARKERMLTKSEVKESFGVCDATLWHCRPFQEDGFDRSKVLKLADHIDFTQKTQRKQASSDIYKDLFTPEIIATPRGWFVRIRTNYGSNLEKEISGKQFVWYDKSKAQDKEEVAYRIAATKFSKEILSEYLKSHPVSDWSNRLHSVNAIKNREGGFSIKDVMTDRNTLPFIRMTEEQCRLYSSMSKEDIPNFLRQLTLKYLNEEDAKVIIKRLKEETNAKMGTLQLPLRERDYSPEIVAIFSNGLSTVLSSLNVSPTSSGYNREWEVGKPKKYDTTDNPDSGTQMSM